MAQKIYKSPISTVLKLVLSQFEIMEYYGYPSYQSYILLEYDEWQETGNKYVVKFLNDIINEAETIFNKKDLLDNKIVFKLKHKKTGKIIYCGYKDSCYRISLAANTETLRIYKNN